LGPKEYSRAGGVLSRAFHDDPLWATLTPAPGVRQARLAEMFTGVAKTVAAANGVAETTTGFEAVALWLPPGREMGLWAMARAGFVMPRFVLTLPTEDRRRMMAVLGQLDEERKKLVPEPHWYLAAIGVEPEHQGSGLGSALVRAGMRRAHRDQKLIYLETETEGNVGYYEHLGFEVVDDMVAAGLGLPLWQMILYPETPRPWPAV
jgi:ribosomal protein S18 acetylase RimI-like enzyme